MCGYELIEVPFSHGELVNYNNIAQDCGVDAKTVKEYFQILVDTLLGFYIEPYTKTRKRHIITATPKFYLFDVGVAGRLSKRTLLSLEGAEAGKAFEHFMITEVVAYRGLEEKDFAIRFWREKSGLAVDLVLGEGEVAIEIKISRSVQPKDIRGLINFASDHKNARAIVVSQDPIARRLTLSGGVIVDILPWKQFLECLWCDKSIL
jgi:predicted AAA+ superfamily ATPase